MSIFRLVFGYIVFRHVLTHNLILEHPRSGSYLGALYSNTWPDTGTSIFWLIFGYIMFQHVLVLSNTRPNTVGFRSIGILRGLLVCKLGLCLHKQHLVAQYSTHPRKQYIVLQYFIYKFYKFYSTILFIYFIYQFYLSIY